MKKIFILMLLTVLLVAPIMAEESSTWDNVKQYDEETKTITIVNTFGMGRDITSIQLLTPLNNKVAIGYGKVAEFEIDLFDDTYSNAFEKMDFYNAKSFEKINREFDYKYLTTELIDVNDYKNTLKGYTTNGTAIYENQVVGTHKEVKEVWKDFDTSILTKGKITIGIFTEVQFGDSVEWIPTFFGKEIDEWAEWTASLNVGLETYYNFDAGSGSVLDDVVLHTKNGTLSNSSGWAPGILGNASSFDGVSNFINITDSSGMFNNDLTTFSFWIYPQLNYTTTQFLWDSQLSNRNFHVINTVVGSGSWDFRMGGAVQVFPNLIEPLGSAQIDPWWTLNEWHHIAVVYNSSGANQFWADGINFQNSTTSWTSADTISMLLGRRFNAVQFLDARLDEFGIWNRTLSPAEILQLFNNGTGITFTNIFGPTVTLNSPIDNFNSSSQTIVFNGTVNTPLNVSLFIDGVLNETNSSGFNNTDYIFTKTILDGNHNWTYESCDPSGCTTETTRTFGIDTINPTITLTAPPTIIDSHSIGNPLFLNWTVNDLNLDQCWFNYNATNTTVTCNDNTTTFNTIEGEQDITFYANDTFGNENLENTSWSYAFLETGVSFNGNVSETSNQLFEINVTTDITVLSISALLNYNGTNHTSIASCVLGNCTISNTLDIPLVPTSSGEFTLFDFIWTLSIFNGTDSISIQTTTREQNVTRIHLEECGGGFTTQAMNFTAHDEQNLSRIDPFLFEATFDQWLGNGSVKRQNNFSQLSTTDVDLCISPDTETYFIDAIIEYDQVGNNSQYTTRNYFFQNDTINNVSVDTFLFLLLASDSTSFILKVQDDSLLPVAGALIEINRFYPGENVFRIVQIARTDDLGKSIGFFETEIVDYKFLITFNNATLLETGLQKIIPETSPFTLTFNIGDPLGEPWKTQNEIADLNSSLILNDSSGIITYEYIDTSNNFDLARLFVIRQSLVNQTNDTIICNVNSSLTSATLTCNVSDTAGFYVASGFITRFSFEELDLQINFQIETLSSVVGLLGLFFGWFLVLIASFMFKFNEIAGIWSVTITVLLINIMGLINFGGVFVTATIALAIILTWIMER